MTEQNILSDIQQAEQQALSVFSGLWETGIRNSEIYGLQHLTQDEYDEIVAKQRYPYQIDITSHAVNTLLGMQRNARFDIFFNAREQGDEVRAELYNAVWKYFADLYSFEHVESDVFQDGAVSSYGVFGTYLDKSRTIAGDLKVCRVPFDELLWDTNFRQYNLEDAGWMARLKFYRRSALKVLHPDRIDLIDKIGTEEKWTGGRALKKLYINRNQDLVGVHEFYERSFKNIFLVSVDGQLGQIQKAYRTEEEAIAEVQQANQIWDAAELSGQAQGKQRPNMQVEPYQVATVNKTEAVSNAILTETTEFSMGKFPYTPYFAYFHDGDFWSVVDRLKDPQIFLDRMYQQADHWIGVGAKGLLRLDSREKPEVVKEVTDKHGKTGGVVITKYPFQEINSAGVAPQLFSLMDRVEMNAEKSMGGANQMGLKQTASESGRAVLARLQQSGLDHFVPMDNMRRTKAELGRDIAWYLSNEITTPRVLRIVGDKLAMQSMSQGGIAQYFKQDTQKQNVGYLQINTEPSNSLEGLDVDIIVDEAGHSPTKNAATLNSLADLGKAGVLTVPPPPEVVIELSDLPQSLKQIWIQSIQQSKAEQKDPLVKNVSVNYKDLPPEAKMDVLQKMGLSATTMGIAAKEIMDKPHISGQQKAELTEKEKANS
ncbi:MAG: hypothetical protein PHS34_08765 [Candidatus Omnitrophica bacterium]|jgi:hypothetical protein|nr:hypothetical protein [Candidatus Omnitrophota bacterium]